jgi:hypothetical protein
MFLILKTLDWKEEDFTKNNIVPFGWCEDNNRAISKNKEIVAKVETMEQVKFVLDKLNNKYVRRIK